VARAAAPTNGLGAEGEPIARGATPKDGWPVGRSSVHRPAGEIKVRTTLVDVLSALPRTRVRFPPPPLPLEVRRGRWPRHDDFERGTTANGQPQRPTPAKPASAAKQWRVSAGAAFDRSGSDPRDPLHHAFLDGQRVSQLAYRGAQQLQRKLVWFYSGWLEDDLDTFDPPMD
jgi:hypothetical protein